MKNLLLILSLNLALTAIAIPHERMPRPKRSPVLICKGIDVTFAPYYTIQVWPASPTATHFTVTVIVRAELPGDKESKKRLNAKGTFSKNAFKFSLEDGSVLTGKRLGNGYLSAEYERGSALEELGCQILYPR